MHEYSVVQALMEEIEAQARTHRAIAVHRVHVRIGSLSGVDPELLQTAYGLMRERTLCETAPLVITHVQARWECRRCRDPIPPGGVLRCRACGGPGRLAAGDEILLERLEMEVDDV